MGKWIFRLLLAAVFMLTVSLAYGGNEREIPLSEVPEKILEAAQEAVPGIEFTEAEIEETKEGTVYELEGILDGKYYEIEITTDGKVLQVEEEKDEDDDKDEQEEDEEDDDD